MESVKLLGERGRLACKFWRPAENICATKPMIESMVR